MDNEKEVALEIIRVLQDNRVYVKDLDRIRRCITRLLGEIPLSDIQVNGRGA